jgi:hypothetical protein
VSQSTAAALSAPARTVLAYGPASVADGPRTGGPAQPKYLAEPATSYRAQPMRSPLPPGKAEIRSPVSVRTADGMAVTRATLLVPESTGVVVLRASSSRSSWSQPWRHSRRPGESHGPDGRRTP